MLNKDQAIANIVELQKIFPRSFAIYGTALGSIRENDIISHDLDTDLGIMSPDFKWEHVVEACRQGFRILHIFGMWHHGLEIAFGKGGVKTDLMLFYFEDEHVFNCLWDNGNRNGLEDQIVHEYPVELFSIQEGLLQDKKIRTLGLDYIKHVYGDEWQTPILKWDWRKDHKCRKKTG